MFPMVVTQQYLAKTDRLVIVLASTKIFIFLTQWYSQRLKIFEPNFQKLTVCVYEYFKYRYYHCNLSNIFKSLCQVVTHLIYWLDPYDLQCNGAHPPPKVMLAVVLQAWIGTLNNLRDHLQRACAGWGWGFKAPIRTPSARQTRAAPPARRRGFAPPVSSPGPLRTRLTGVRRRGGPRCWPGGRGPRLPSRLCRTGRGRRGEERDPALAERTRLKIFMFVQGSSNLYPLCESPLQPAGLLGVSRTR